MLLLPMSEGDPARSVGTAVLNQALADLQHYTPQFIAGLVLRAKEATELNSRKKLRDRWGEASDTRQGILDWVGTPDFSTVVDWSGLEESKVEKVFRDLIREQVVAVRPKKGGGLAQP